jgi:hypothetical protein
MSAPDHMLTEGKIMLACTGTSTHVSLHRLRKVLAFDAMRVPPD